MTSNFKARLVFGAAVALLLLSGIAAVATFHSLQKSERLVAHTHEVQNTIANIESASAWASRVRLAYLYSGDENFLLEYRKVARALPEKLEYLKSIARDNPEQEGHCLRLEELTRASMRAWEDSIMRRKAGPLSPPEQAAVSADSMSFASQISSLTQIMRDEEAHLLEIRRQKADRLFQIVIGVFGGTFVSALLLFFADYRLLKTELRMRESAERSARSAEQAAREGQEELRELSVRVLQLQDEERRKFSRELHDSLGQYLVSLKMNLSQLRPSDGQAELVSDSLKLVNESLAETRTMSYLLHPPMLDEIGFASAAEWFVNGFAQRSGIKVDVNIPKDGARFPAQVELALFRVLQEALSNIHKHAKSASAAIALTVGDGQVTLTIKDAGKGSSAEVLSHFRSEGKAGVGLIGMRERVRELGGRLRIDSSPNGTTVTAVIPITKDLSNKPPSGTGQKQMGSAA